jgi:tetratricopeptide (TPR) repeat protein
MEGTENLSREEIGKLPQLTFEDVEDFESMQEEAFLGEPVIIPTDSLRKGKFDEVIDLLPYLEKFPRADFARYLAMAFLSQGEVLLKKSLSEESGIKKALEAQAFNSFDRAIQIAPNPIEAYNSLGVVFGKNGLYEKALECFNWVSSVQPQDEIARHNLAETYSRMGKSSK